MEIKFSSQCFAGCGIRGRLLLLSFSTTHFVFLFGSIKFSNLLVKWGSLGKQWTYGSTAEKWIMIHSWNYDFSICLDFFFIFCFCTESPFESTASTVKKPLPPSKEAGYKLIYIDFIIFYQTVAELTVVCRVWESFSVKTVSPIKVASIALSASTAVHSWV